MKKWLNRIAMGTFALFVLLYGFVFLRSVIPVTVHDEELQMARASIPQGSNAFDVLQAAGNQVWWPKDQDRQISDLANNTNWDDTLAGTILASNRQALASWDAAAKMPDLQVPEIFNSEDSLSYLRVWKELAQLAGVRENLLLHRGQEQEAFDQIVRQIQLGRRMQNAHGVLIVYLVGTAVNNMGLIQMQRWAGKTHLTPQQLKDYIRQLELDPKPEGDAFANSIRGEYQSMIGTMAAMRSGKLTDPETGKSYPHSTRLVPMFNFSRTKALLAQPLLALVKAAPHHFNEAQLPDLDSDHPYGLSMILSGNMIGQIWYQMLTPALIPSLAKKSQADAQLQATRTLLALRAYQLAHGSLPADLNALVPEFLDKVPVDDFDGQPLRYSPERKIVYSVGQNLKDDGGDDRESKTDFSNRHLDLVFQFDFETNP